MSPEEERFFDSFREVVKAVNSTLDRQEVLDLNKGPVDADQSVADAMEGKTISIYNVTQDPRAQYPKEAQAEGISSIISVPLRIKGRVIGVMRLYTPEPREFSEEEINSAEVLAETGAIAIENARMYERIKNDYESIMRDLYR